MVVLKGHTSMTGGGIYWQVAAVGDPGVLTLFADRLQGETRTAPIAGVRYPVDERQAWIFDLDAMREKAEPRTAHAFPLWARGTAHVAPTLEGSMWRFDITPQALSQ
jgi:hypothetical protein